MIPIELLCMMSRVSLPKEIMNDLIRWTKCLEVYSTLRS